jgi:hypothetical protein
VLMGDRWPCPFGFGAGLAEMVDRGRNGVDARLRRILNFPL